MVLLLGPGRGDVSYEQGSPAVVQLGTYKTVPAKLSPLRAEAARTFWPVPGIHYSKSSSVMKSPRERERVVHIGTYNAVKANFWPWLGGKSQKGRFLAVALRLNTFQGVPSSLGSSTNLLAGAGDPLECILCDVQGYLAHVKQGPPRTLL